MKDLLVEEAEDEVEWMAEPEEVVKEAVGEDGGKDEGKGFGGIKMASVQEIIAKARFNESYLHVNLGLSENLEDLAKHFENEQNSGKLLHNYILVLCYVVLRYRSEWRGRELFT